MKVIKMNAGDQLVVVASDAHYLPGKKSTAHKALCVFLNQEYVNTFVFNGDAFDFPTLSKYPPIGWEKHPSVKKEIEVVQERLREIAACASNYNQKVRLLWALGNHDARFNKALAAKIPQLKGVYGTKLSDFFPGWEPCWRVEVGSCVIKHELKSGSNPLKSNLIAAGKSIVTGHHHSQNVLAYTDYAGTRYSVDAGCLADVDGPQFDYGESNPANWRSGFVVLKFYKGKLLPPMLATVLDEKKGDVWYNGSTFNVKQV